MIMPWVAFLIIEKSSELQNREICQIFFVISRATFVFSNSKSGFYYRDVCTGWPKSKFEMSFGYNSETMHFWPYVGKAKMRLRSVQFFWQIVNKQLKIVNKQLKIKKNWTPLKRILALPTWGQKCIVSEL